MSVKVRLFFLAFLFYSAHLSAQLRPAVADSFLNFIKANKDRASIYVSRNDTVISALNENRTMPLASTFKILVAIEFAKQAAAEIIDKDRYVALSELDKYYLANTDGNAHPGWIAYEKTKNHIRADSVRLIDVARGMMMFSSNANTEYLIDLLGVNNVRTNVELFGLKSHTPIYAPPASLLMYQNPNGKDERRILKDIKKFSDENYAMQVYKLHVQLKRSPRFKSLFRLQDLSIPMQQTWSDRLPASTTKDYVHLVKLINKRKFLSEDAYKVLSEVMEFYMENNSMKDTFKHYGAKGGNTAFVLTHVVYFKTNTNITMEWAVFFNHLSQEEEIILSSQLDYFEGQIIADPVFRSKLGAVGIGYSTLDTGY